MNTSDCEPRKIAILGAFGQHNFGNECTLQAFLWKCRKHLPNATITCICTVPDEISRRHQIAAFPLSCGDTDRAPRRTNVFVRLLARLFIRLPMELAHCVKANRFLANTDVLFIPGTGLLTDAYQNSFGWPYDIFKWSVLARMHRSKIVYVSVGAGPLHRPLSRWFIRRSLALAHLRSYRDSATRDFLSAIGSPTSADPVYPDLAFNVSATLLPSRHGRPGPRPMIGLGLMAYVQESSADSGDPAIDVDYLEKVALFAKWLLRRNYDVRLLIGDALHDEAARQRFRRLMSRQESSSSDGRIIDEPITSVDQLLAQLAATDAVVATRFHNVVFAFLLNKPVISLACHEKCISLMHAMGLSEYCQDIRRLNVDGLIAQFRDLERNATSLQALIEQRTDEWRRALDEQYARIFDYVRSAG